MQFIYTHDRSKVTEELADTITHLLGQGMKVLWLVSGGSGAQVSIDVASRIQDADLNNLYVTLSDERFGTIGHPNENWQQLLNGGFKLPGATLYRTLTGDIRQETSRKFADWLEKTLEDVDYTIGLFGIGPDGHTAGIKPESPAVTSKELAIDYDGEDFERITITPAFISNIDEAVIQAFGNNKHAALAQLLTTDVPTAQQPAQVLKLIPKSILYTDYKENKS